MATKWTKRHLLSASLHDCGACDLPPHRKCEGCRAFSFAQCNSGGVRRRLGSGPRFGRFKSRLLPNESDGFRFSKDKSRQCASALTSFTDAKLCGGGTRSSKMQGVAPMPTTRPLCVRPHPWRRSLPAHFAAALAADGADKTRLDIRQPNIIRPPVAADRGPVRAPAVATIDQQTTDAGRAHFGEGDLSRSVGHGPIIAPIPGRRKPLWLGTPIPVAARYSRCRPDGG
jgi:hypothetical protein